MQRVIRVVTRGSALATTQTRQVIDLLAAANPLHSFELVTVTTTGDRVTDRPLSSFRGTGVFVKEPQNELLTGKADLAVHSLKDMPVEQHPDLHLAACPVRGNPLDVLLSGGGSTLPGLPQGALVGSSSPRRMLQLRSIRPDLRFSDLRGNVDTRIRKLAEGHYDAIVAAAAGLERLGIQYDRRLLLEPSVCLPAAGQGILAVECRSDDTEARAIAAAVNHHETMYAALYERDFLDEIGGGCELPVAALAEVSGNVCTMEGMIGDPQTGRQVRSGCTFTKEESATAVRKFACQLMGRCDREGVCFR